MKNSITNKATLIGASLVVFALWEGYALGYHHGVRDENREWWSTVRLDSQGNRVFLGPQAKGQFDAPFTVRNSIPDKLVP
jgi:hypothetical protein